MGNMFFVLLFQCLAILLIIITGRIKNETFQKYRTKLKKKIMFSGIIDTCNESYLMMVISVLIELHSMKHGTKAEKFSLSLAFFFILIVIGLPMFYLIAL